MKILNFKKWITVPETSKRLSAVFEEEVTEADVLRLALDGKLKLSVQFVNHAPALCAHAKPIEQATYREAPELAGFVPASIREKHGELPVCMMVGTQVSALHVAEFGDEVENLHGVYDLSMIGAERLDVEHRYQFLTNGPGVTLTILNGPIVVDSDGRLCQLQERAPERDLDTSSLSDEVAAVFAAGAERRKKRPLYHADNYYPAASLPSDSVLVVRTASLVKFEKLINEDSDEEKQLSTTERNSLLKMVIGMAIRGYGYEPTAKKSASPKEISADLEALGLSVSNETVLKYLREATDKVLPAKTD